MHRPRTALGALGLGDLNASLDASHISTGGGLDTTARLESRKSLSSSAVGRMSFIKSAPGTAKKPTFGVGRPSIASKENVDRCGEPQECASAPRGHLTPSLPSARPYSNPQALKHGDRQGQLGCECAVGHCCEAVRKPRNRAAWKIKPHSLTVGTLPLFLHPRSADMPDPRPINSASWKAEAAQKVRHNSVHRSLRLPLHHPPPPSSPPTPRRKVFDLLTATEYPQRVSTKLLLGPTAKDFQAILTHMLRCIDPHYIMVRSGYTQVGQTPADCFNSA